MCVIGVDQSKRSTAATCLDLNGNLVDFILINPPMELDKEQLIHYQWEKLQFFFEQMKLKTNGKITAFALEGAAFTAVGASNDLLWGVQWYIRTRIMVEYPEVPIGILTAATWRSTLVPIKEQRAFKIQYGGKVGLKHAVVSKIPENDLKRMNDYLDINKDRINAVKVKDWKPGSKSQEYKKCLFDIVDSWGIAKHRLSLIPKTLVLKRRK